jgi:hypothetical protein
MSSESRAEAAWRWVCRGLAVAGFAVLLIGYGVDAPWGFYVLLVGLFFGPDAIRGQLQINRKANGE